MELLVALMNKTFPANRDLQNKIRAALLYLLRFRDNPEEMPIISLGLGMENDTLHLIIHVNVEGISKHIYESVYLLVGLGFGTVLTELAETGLRSEAKFCNIPLEQDCDAQWTDLANVVEIAVNDWSGS